MTPSELSRFEAKVERIPFSTCWWWTGLLTGFGYGRLWDDGKRHLRYAHRLAYEHWIGPLVDGLTIDHLCRHPSCVNPTHCEQVSMRENVMRGTSFAPVNAAKVLCKRGHALVAGNLRRNRTGYRQCLTCARTYDKSRRAT